MSSLFFGFWFSRESPKIFVFERCTLRIDKEQQFLKAKKQNLGKSKKSVRISTRWILPKPQCKFLEGNKLLRSFGQKGLRNTLKLLNSAKIYISSIFILSGKKQT